MSKLTIKKVFCFLCVLGILCSVLPDNLIVYAKAEMSIKPTRVNCIFEQQDNVECTAVYSTQTAVEVSVTDYYGKNVFNKSWTGSGEETKNVSVGHLGTGWYKVTLKADSKTVSSSFAVVPDLSERCGGKSPFSTDLAANSILKSDVLAGDYADSAKKAGLNRVRERYSWWTNDYSEFENAINMESEAGLDVIAVSTDYSRGGYQQQKDMFTDDLFKVYNYQKNMSSYFGDKVDVWEICNETDHDNFGEIPADVFSPFYKAAAIAVKDSCSGSSVMFGGLCLNPNESDFAGMMMKNDILRYSDAYNIHRHLPAAYTSIQAFDTEFVKRHKELMLTSGYDRPIWITEAGLAMSAVTDNNLKKQARYAITSAAESIASGTDRHFWFILPQFKTGDKFEYGVFNEKNEPNPAYASLAVMTYILGAGDYKGKLNSSDVNGYLFNNGTNDVLVAWSNKSSYLNFTQSYQAYDMMGNSVSGDVKAGYDPVYLVFNSAFDTGLYTKAVSSEKQSADALNKKDRIIIQTDYNGIESLKSVRNKGYLIGENESRVVKVKVYNFNDSSVEGILNCGAEGFKIIGNGQKVTIPAMSSASAEITITPETVNKDVPQYVSFYVTTEDGNTSPTVAKLIETGSVRIDAKNVQPDRASAGGYWRDYRGLIFNNRNIEVDLSNPSSNPSNLAISDGTVCFDGKGEYVEYVIDANEAGSYYINFRRKNLGSGSFYIFAEVNGETVNRRTGRVSNPDGSYTFQDEVQLEKGKNIIKIGNMSSYGGKLLSLSLSKTDDVQYTTSMNTYSGGRAFTASYKPGLSVDPWLWINDSVSSYPDGDDAPYVTFEVAVPKSGFYCPIIAAAGDNKIKLNVDGRVFPVNDNCTVLTEKYKASGSGTCSWLKSNDAVYLQEGAHEVTLSLYGATAAKWNTYIGAVRFAECMPKVYDGDFTLDLSDPQENYGTEISGNALKMTKGDWTEYEVFVSEDASYYVTFNREDAEDNKNFYIAVTADGKTVNRRTGRIQNPDNSYTFQNEVQLKKGRNTVRIETMGQNSGTVSDVSFKKLENYQYTVSMNDAGGKRVFKSAYKNDISVDPWIWINDLVSDYPDGDTAPFVTFEVAIGKSGYYYPSAAASGVNKVKLNVDGVDFPLNDNCTVLDESYKASGQPAAACAWLKSNDSVYLEKGRYDVTVSLYGAAGEKWNTSIGAVRFIEKPVRYSELPSPIWAEYDIDVEETGAYSIRVASGGNSRLKLTVNGSQISYKTGSKTIGDFNGYSKWSSYENLVPLYKGTNTVRVETMSKSDTIDLILSEVVCIKSDDVPKTGITAKALTDIDTNIEELALDPWAYIDVEQSEVPYIRWNFEVSDTGSYKVRLAYGGASKPEIRIAGSSISFEKAAKTGEYCLYGLLGRFAPWYEASDSIYLEKGIYEVKMSLIPGYLSESGKWQMGFAGFQLAEAQKAPIISNVSASVKDNYLSVNYEAASGDKFDIIAVSYNEKNGLKALKNVYEPISVFGANAKGVKAVPTDGEEDDEFEVFIWNSLNDMKPVLEKIKGTGQKIRRLELD